MRYWGYLVAKLVVGGALWFGFCWGISSLLPEAKPWAYAVDPKDASLHPIYVYGPLDTFVTMLYGFTGVGLAWLILWDQRHRCRTCVRRLMMPVLTGSWTHVLFGRPRTEYICPYGHGTLKVEELQLTGHRQSDWEPHEDMWKELASFDDEKK